MLTLLPGTDTGDVLKTLTDVSNKLGPLASGDVQTVHTGYLRWANDTADALGTRITSGDVERLVLTPRHWALQSLVLAPHSGLMSLVQLEIREVQRRLAASTAALNEVYERWKRARGTLVVADTNAYLHHREEFDKVDWAYVVGAASHEPINLVLPMVVIDELDRQKRTKERSRARTTLRCINALFTDPTLSATVGPASGSGEVVVAHLFLDDPRRVRLPHPDSELVDRAQSLAALTGRDITMVTFDTGMVLRARAAGLSVRHLDEQDEKIN